MPEKLKLILASFVLMCSFACGGEPPASATDGEVIGAAEQAVYRPANYGTEGGTGPICSGSWDDGECWVPNSKTFYVKIHYETCNNWWDARLTAIYNEMLAEVDYLNSMIHEDATPWYMGPVPELWGEPLVAPGLIYNWSCDSRLIAFGGFSPNESNSDDIDAGGGNELRQYKGGQLYVFTTNIEAQPLWAASDDARRQRFARNVIRHEAWHEFGHGHENNGLMGNGDFWNNEYWPPMNMYERQACYNPSNGGLFSDC